MPPELVIVGPAGTGKTYAILAVIHALCKRHPLRVLFLRATRVSLTESMLVTYEDEILAKDRMRGLSDGAGRAHRLAYKYPSGAAIVTAGLDRNPSRVLSTAWDLVYINECIEVKHEVWETLGSRLNRPGRQTLGWLIGDTNPGAPDHWLKKRCDKGLATLWETGHQANPAMHDGRDWTPIGEHYLDTLGRLTGVRRKRLLEGQWVQGEGVWFDTFDPQVHVTPKAEYDPFLKTYLAIDTGVWTGAVWFQVRDTPDGDTQVTVFDEHLTTADEHHPAFAIGKEIVAKSGARPIHRTLHDPAGRSAEALGGNVIGEFLKAGLDRRMEGWPVKTQLDSLTLLEAFVGGAEDSPPAGLFIHPRCTNLVNAFGGYMRAQRAGQWVDKPVDPQHPYEEMIDALRGGLCAVFPEGRRPPPKYQRRKASQVF